MCCWLEAFTKHILTAHPQCPSSPATHQHACLLSTTLHLCDLSISAKPESMRGERYCRAWRQVDSNLLVLSERAVPASEQSMPVPSMHVSRFFTRCKDELANHWIECLLLVIALGPFANFITSLRTVLGAIAHGAPRGRYFRLIPLSVEDSFTAGETSSTLGGASMPVERLQVLQGSGAGGAWVNVEGAGNATLDRSYRGAAIINLASLTAADGFMCLLERVKDGAPPPLFRLESSLDGASFEVVTIPPWTTITVKPNGIWDSEAVGGGRVIWDLQLSWGWVLDFVVAQGATAVLLSAGAVLGASGHGRLGTLALAVMCLLRTGTYIFILTTASDAKQTITWGDAKSIADFYVPRMAVYALLTCILARDGPGTLETFVIFITALNGVYYMQRRHDGGEHGTVVSLMTCLVAMAGMVYTLGRGWQLMKYFSSWFCHPRRGLPSSV
jgi:hypothetical protein